MMQQNRKLLLPVLTSIAMRNLMRNKTRTVLSAVGIIIGIFAICSLGMSGAALTETIDDMREENVNLLMLSPNAKYNSIGQDENTFGVSYKFSKDDVSRIESAVKKVTSDYALSPIEYVIKSVTVNHKTQMQSAYLFGDKDNLEVMIGGYLKEGYLPRTDTNVIILTSTAEKYNLKPGSHLKATTVNDETITLKVTGIIDDTLPSSVFGLTLTPDLILAPEGLYDILNGNTAVKSDSANSTMPVSNSDTDFAPKITTDITAAYNINTNTDISGGVFLNYDMLKILFAGILTNGSIPHQTNDILIFKEFAKKYNLDVGFTLPISSSSSSGTVRLNIAGLIDDGIAEHLHISENYIIGTSELYAMLYPKTDEITYSYVMIRLDNPAIRERATASIVQELNGNLNKISDDHVSVRDLSALTGDLENAFSMAVLLGIGISTIALVVASISIANVMIISVKERKQEIGVMRSIGTTRRQITMIFLIEEAAIGIFGSVIGVILSCIFIPILLMLIMHSAAYFLLPSVLIYIPLGLLAGIAVCVLSGLYPAVKASRLNPIEAMER